MKTHLGHYEIVEELGRGGMGVVYKGFEPALGRYVAIKELSPSLAHDPNLVERFLREARSMAALNDPHIIQIYFIGTDESTGQPFFAMEFVEGESLSALLKREGRLEPEQALKIIRQTAQGLSTAHAKGVIHRDLKPGNLMITPRGNVKIADFGIALATQDFSKKLTSTGEFVGTPGYLSPEVCIGKTVDQRSDIFSLGIVLFEMLSGRVPFTDESPLGLMLEVVKAEFPDIRQLNGEVDAQAATILGRMIAKEPEERFQSCEELVAALSEHPLAMRDGGTLRMTAVPTGNMATVVGAPTPASQKQRVATPPPVVRTASGAAAPAVEPPAQPASQAAASRPSVLERQAPHKSGLGLPLAIAAAVVLLLGGAAFAMRGTLMDYARGFKDGFAGASSAYEDGVAAGKASNPIPLSQASELPADADRAASANAASDAPTPAEGVTASLADWVEIAAATPANEASQAADAPAATTTAGAPASESLAPAAVTQPAQAPATIARAEPVRRPAPPPRIAVVAMGDTAITGPARQRIEERLQRAGFELADADLLPSRNDVAGLLDALQRHAVAVVVVRAEAVGSQELQYYGRSSTLYTANLNVRAYLVPEKRPLGAGFRAKVNFTNINADTEAESAVQPHLDGLVDTLTPYRSRRG
ncbi:MAG: serine/threonine-protein kinase [Lysobacteraceae bacterium]